MAMADLARQGTGDGRRAVVSLSDISVRQGISLSFLEQLFGKLRRAGLVTSHRGTSGGYSLSRAPQTITLDTVIHAVNVDIRAYGCTPETNIACTGRTDRCLTHNLWGALETHIEGFLSSITIQDVIDERLPAPEVAE